MRLTANVDATIKNFASVMTNKEKVLSETIQNARRAGAKRVEFNVTEHSNNSVNLEIIDDGCGIVDFNALFSLSDSGWSDEIKKTEFSFGMGFYAVIFGCDNVRVESCGQAMDIDCEVARMLGDFGEPFAFAGAPTKGTRIIMSVVSLSIDVVRYHLTELARYSSIEVYFNGENLKRDKSLQHAIDHGKEVVSSPFGDVVISRTMSLSVRVVLQDLPVYEYYGSNEANVFFSQTLSARMPDRDKLREENTVILLMQEWLRDYFKAKLGEIRQHMANDEVFLDQYFDCVVKYDAKTLNEIDYLPASAFQKVYYPVTRSDYESLFNEPVSLRRGQSYFGFIGDVDCGIAANFLYFAKAYIINEALPDGHWFLAGCVNDLEDSDFHVNCEEGYRFSFQLDYSDSGDVVVAKRVSITHKPTQTTAHVIDDGFVVKPQEYWGSTFEPASCSIDGVQVETPTIVIQSVDGHLNTGNDLLLQMHPYINSNDEWLETELDLDTESFARQFLASTGGDITSIMSEIVGYLPQALRERLDGKSLIMTVDAGKVVFRLAA